MHYGLTRRQLLGSTAAAGALGLAPKRLRAQQETIKAAWVYIGPIGDHGWTYRHNVGREAVIAHFGDRVETSYVENVAEGPDAERVINQLARAGNDIVFTTSFGFMNPTIKVASQFPDIKFEHCTGYKTADNVAIYNARFYQGRTVIGDIAGRMSESGIVGYIGSFPIPEVVMGINAFTLAMHKHQPEAQVKVVWVNSWYDPGKEADAARTLIDQGADIITQHTDSPAPLQVAQERGVMGFGQASDMARFAPEAQLTSIIDDWNNYYIDRCQKVLDGTWETSNIWWGLKEGLVGIAPYGPKVPEDVVAEAEAIRVGIIDGSVDPFNGPIMDQSGAERVPSGGTVSDEDLLRMDWYVQGVQA